MKGLATLASEGRLPQRTLRWSLLLNGLLLLAVLHHWQSASPGGEGAPVQTLRTPGEIPFDACRQPLPAQLLSKLQAPAAAHPALRDVSKKLEAVLGKRFSQGGIDSISVALVTPEGPSYEGFWGVRRANETEEARRGAVDRHTIYRLASISKLFSSLETLILRDRGVLNLDDSVHRYLPLPYNADHGAITFRQLMSHMAGIGRDWPSGDASEAWPHTLFGGGPPAGNGLPFPAHDDIFAAFEQNRMPVPPYTVPIYSNTGFSLLGMANVAANQAFEGDGAPGTYAELVQRDIFGPLGLNGSSFLATGANAGHVAVASVAPHEIGQDFLDASNGSGGQMSSLADLAKIVQMLLDPSRTGSLISPLTMREWLLTLYAYPDGVTGMGMLWEMLTLIDRYSRPQKLYIKMGELSGYHSIVSFVPSASYGVVLLTTGPVSESLPLLKLIYQQVQVAFDTALEDAAREQLVGTWRSADGRGSVTVVVEDGSLFVSEYVLDGTDVLETMQFGKGKNLGAPKLAMWSTAEDEFKLAVHGEDPACLIDATMLDNYGYINGSSVNLLRVRREGNVVVLELPAVGVDLHRG